MKMYSYLEGSIKNLIIVNSISILTREEFSRELNGYWKKIRINFIDVAVLEGWMNEILKDLDKKNSLGTIVIYVTSYSLSIYLNRLGIEHVYLSQYKNTNSIELNREN